jgi:hypothetical protein
MHRVVPAHLVLSPRAHGRRGVGRGRALRVRELLRKDHIYTYSTAHMTLDYKHTYIYGALFFSTSWVPCLCTRGSSTSVNRQKQDFEDRPEPICSAIRTQFGRPSLRAVLNCSYARSNASSYNQRQGSQDDGKEK